MCSVETDNVRGGYLAAQHLIAGGCRRLLFAGAHRFPAVVDRLQGARKTAAGAGHRVSLEVMTTDGVTAEDGYGVAEDLSVIGYDNNREAWSSLVPLTTMDQAGVEMGRAATELILDELRQPRAHEHRKIVMEPVLVPKASTRPVDGLPGPGPLPTAVRAT